MCNEQADLHAGRGRGSARNPTKLRDRIGGQRRRYTCFVLTVHGMMLVALSEMAKLRAGPL
eukprot:5830296-Alexandrium_andersonii.AAC.1